VRERGVSGLAELGGSHCFMGWGLVGPRGKKEKRKRQAGLGWKEGMGEGLFWFFSSFFSNSFSFISFLNFDSKPFFKFLNKLLTTQSIKNPCIQHDAQSLGISKLINYHFIY
jgi:hypothetical protein